MALFDVKTTPRRSALMKKVRRSDTSAERSVRELLRKLGAHYRLNVSGLPGRPDIAHKGLRKAVFVHGCFWHYHEGCSRGRIPERNHEFWKAKLEGNRYRDQKKERELIDIGYDVLVIWECELEDEPSLGTRLQEFWMRESIRDVASG